jgi:transmembrane sensor
VRLRDNDSVDVLVRKGDVNLTGRREPVTVNANETAHVSSHGVKLERLDESEVQRRLQWTTGYLSFSGETLEEVVEEFNRYNMQQLIIEDRSIRRLQIGGNFQSTDPEGFVAALRPMGVQRADAAAAGSSAGLIRLVGVQVR